MRKGIANPRAARELRVDGTPGDDGGLLKALMRRRNCESRSQQRHQHDSGEEAA